MSATSVTVNGVASPVVQGGAVDKPEAIVFVHGNPGSREDWADLAGRIDFARTVVPEMPGFGQADKPSDFDYSVDGYADHLEGVLQQLGVKRVHLVLHDFGGPFGLAWAAAHPDSLASVVLINTGVLMEYRWHRYARIWRTPVLGEAFMAASSRFAVRTLVGRENPRLTRAQLDQIYEQGAPRGTKRAVLKLYRATPESQLASVESSLNALDRPALVVWGTDDVYLPVAQADKQRRAFPRARVELIEGGGHWVMLEEPDRVADLVIPFLRDQVAP
jgi:pimeloyl-ACP methyl ester carboxylesterase